MSMISNALITGGVFSQNIQVDQRQTQKSAIDRLQDAVAHAAFHNSGERFDPPKCHPNTRVAVLDKIDKWALRTDPDTRNASILWLSGAAGAGKSAIAQTLAEHFHSKGLLIASFFFGRSDSTRNHARSLVSTIVYQLYALLPPSEQSRILGVIDRDPLIFTKSLLAQFETLIVNPLRPLFENGFWASINAPRLVIIDGLDECLDRDMQRNVLLMLSASVRQFHSPFIFLLASRPEHDIQAMFSSPDLLLPIHTRLFLDDTYLPDHDIELLLRDQFKECRTTHPFRQMIPPNWPSDDIVKKLTRKSSGQFIYASVVAKYVKSSRHRPHHRLDVVLNLRPASRDLPFAELDTLYTHIFSGVEDIDRVLNIISFSIIHRNLLMDHMEQILLLDAGEVAILFCDLASIIRYEPAIHQVSARLTILHASLVDYLLDSARSKEYYIDLANRHAVHVADCFRFLSYVQCQSSSVNTARSAMFCFEYNHLSLRLDLTEPLYNAIRGFSISRIYNSALSMHDYNLLHHNPIVTSLPMDFLPALFAFLKKSDSAKYVELYQHHQSDYDLFLRENINACSPETQSPISLIFALVTLYRKLPIGAFHRVFSLLDSLRLGDRVPTALRPYMYQHVHLGHEYFSDFLRDPKRSRECSASPKLFAHAAKHCLFYLCDHTAHAQQAPPRMLAQQRMRRKCTPWKWHRRVLREDIRGPRVTPWLWLQPPTPYGSVAGAPVLHRKRTDLFYIHSRADDIPWDGEPVVKHRINSEKYYLALIYLNCFLPKAGKLDDLVHMCQRLTFASRCQDFPLESARAWSNMQIYAAKWR